MQAAAKDGVQLLALSDHDTVSGVAEAVSAGAQAGVQVVPAVEISAIDDRAQTPIELHILGYLIDIDDKPFNAKLEEFLSDREQRTLRMRDALLQAGFALDEEELQARIAAEQPIGRPHLANAVLRAHENEARLREEGIDEIGALIKAYLIEGKPAFRMRERPTVQEATAAIHGAGGLAVWAHPFWDIAEANVVSETIERFKGVGIDGVEAFYITHTQAQTELSYRRCEELSLLSTGSADFHGPTNKLFSKFRAFQTYGLTPNLGAIGAAA